MFPLKFYPLGRKLFKALALSAFVGVHFAGGWGYVQAAAEIYRFLKPIQRVGICQARPSRAPSSVEQR